MAPCLHLVPSRSSNNNQEKAVQLEMIDAQRKVLLSAMEDGTYSSELVNAAMANLDADQISLEIRGGSTAAH